MRTLKISGCSISTPLKSQIIPFLDQVEPVASATNSVNTVVNRAGILIGENTDIDGIEYALRNRFVESIRVFGAGSVVHSLLAVLRKRGVKRVFVAARNADSRKKLNEQYSLQEDSGEEVDLLVNATPASLDPSQTELFQLVNRSRAVFDLLVSAKKTPLLEAAAQAGKETISGVEMSKGQLKRQFEIYTGLQVSAQEIDEVVARAFSG
jgi:shikimate dehydrogenase